MNNINKNTYDSLAEEYESRVNDLIPITQEAINICSNYLKANARVLDVGCAVGLAVKLFSEKGFKTTGIELSDKMVEYAKKRNSDAIIILGDFLKHDFGKEKFDGIYMSAFIHLFPKSEINSLFYKINNLLNENGFVFISTTKSEISKEGLEEKKDYKKKELRFRKHWTEEELEETLIKNKLKILNKRIFTDPYKKTWMGFIAQK